MTLKSLKRQVLFLVLISILLGGLLVQKSFASCITLSSPESYSLGSIRCKWGNCDNYGLSESYCSEIMEGCIGTCSGTQQIGTYFYTSASSNISYCDNSVSGCYVNSVPNKCYYYIRCDTQAEADSIYCAMNPDASGCFTAKDTTTYGCKDEIEITQGGAVTYHAVYKFTGKTTQGGGVEWSSYEELENSPMSCADVGYCEYGQTKCLGDLGGWYAQSSSSSSEINWSSSSVSCKQTGQYGNTCFFECDNGAVGQCEGNDGDCSIVSDCEWLIQSSASGEPTSSASGQSASSENPDLQVIIDNQNTQIGQLNYNNGKLDSIDDKLKNQNNKTDATNSLLAQIANNIGQINNKSSVITNNTYNYGDSSGSKDYTGNLDALADSLGSISGKLSEMLESDSGTLDTSEFVINIDSLLDTSYTTYGDSLDGAYTSFGDTYKGIISDTGAIGKFTDSLAQLQKKFNFTSLGGSGTGCPAFMQKTYTIKIWKVSIDFDLNKLKICSPILGDKTPWDIARALLRAIVSITCMWFIFKCATGAYNGESE